jgi:hypothetical protein
MKVGSILMITILFIYAFEKGYQEGQLFKVVILKTMYCFLNTSKETSMN